MRNFARDYFKYLFGSFEIVSIILNAIVITKIVGLLFALQFNELISTIVEFYGKIITLPSLHILEFFGIHDVPHVLVDFLLVYVILGSSTFRTFRKVRKTIRDFSEDYESSDGFIYVWMSKSTRNPLMQDDLSREKSTAAYVACFLFPPLMIFIISRRFLLIHMNYLIYNQRDKGMNTIQSRSEYISKGYSPSSYSNEFWLQFSGVITLAAFAIVFGSFNI